MFQSLHNYRAHAAKIDPSTTFHKIPCVKCDKINKLCFKDYSLYSVIRDVWHLSTKCIFMSYLDQNVSMIFKAKCQGHR